MEDVELENYRGDDAADQDEFIIIEEDSMGGTPSLNQPLLPRRPRVQKSITHLYGYCVIIVLGVAVLAL